MKDVKGYEGLYFVDESGRIFGAPSKSNGYKLSQRATWINSRGYECVTLYIKKAAKRHVVHRIVATTFTENTENKPFVNHRDGNKQNNNVSNLEWVTGKENVAHAVKMGLVDFSSGKQVETRVMNGKKNGKINGMKSRRKFSFFEAEEIRKLHEIGKISCRKISLAYGVSGKTIDNICNHKTYLEPIP